MINLAKYILRKLRPLLPFHILRFVINLYFNRHFIKSYSQYGEDLIIVDFFKRYFLKSSKLNLEMSYLDIDAFHPIMISNTHRSVYNFLEKNGYCHLFTTGGSVAYYKKL